MASTEDHDWVRERLAAWRSGLQTDPAEEKRLQSHLAYCQPCREAAMLFDAAPTDEPADEHIPNELIARWNRARDSLAGLERAMVRQHLEECSSCRKDLELLGFEATLGRDPAPVSATSPEPAPHPSPVASSGSVRRDSRRAVYTPWILGGWGLAMTAAVIVLALAHTGPHRSDGGGPTTLQASTSLSLETAPTLVLSSSRGGEPQVIETSEQIRSIVLGMPDIRRFPSETLLAIEVHLGDASLLRRSIRAGELTSRSGLVLTSKGPWAPGTYRIRVFRSEELLIEYVFDLERTTTR